MYSLSFILFHTENRKKPHTLGILESPPLPLDSLTTSDLGQHPDQHCRGKWTRFATDTGIHVMECSNRTAANQRIANSSCVVSDYDYDDELNIKDPNPLAQVYRGMDDPYPSSFSRVARFLFHIPISSLVLLLSVAFSNSHDSW